MLKMTFARVGQVERRTQNRVLRLFQDQLGYAYLGDWSEREDNRNVDDGVLSAFLRDTQGYEPGLITRAVAELTRAANATSLSLYDRNRRVYELLRYGAKVRPDIGETTVTVKVIDWDNPERNRFAVAEEVTVAPLGSDAHGKRPDVVLYVNGIALGVLELKRSTVSVAEGIRQNIDSQKEAFIEPFFSTVQLVMAGNDTEGLRYGVIETREKFYLSWKESSEIENPLDRALRQVCEKSRFLELIHDFIVFDAGTKKICRPNQYFGVKAAQAFADRREGGVIWHTQGSGKSLTMVWLAKWLREHVTDARILIITDRTELDDQIEGVFHGVDEEIYRTHPHDGLSGGGDLLATLGATKPWLVCSLIQKFGSRPDTDDVEGDIDAFIDDIERSMQSGFEPKGTMFVFVDECHRSQSDRLHRAMRAILGEGATLIGFTGTPLLKADKKRSIEVFGPYIHTYKFDEAVRDGVILDLRYEARDIDQRMVSQERIDAWFDAKTRGLTEFARAQLKRRWGTMSEVLSSRSRLNQIVSDVLFDFATRDRLLSGRGNAILVADSIYMACKFYELFSATDLAGKCAIVTSYRPSVGTIKGEDSGEGETERLAEYAIYRKMLASWFREPEEIAVNRSDRFETEVKKKFVEEPGQMRLLIVVDKLLTGFDAPPASYLYIDKQMRDHGLFQAICRVNRLDSPDKEYGSIVDYKDLFRSLEGAVSDYTGEAFEGYDRNDVAGLLRDRLEQARERLDETREAVKALCEPVAPPRETVDYIRYFCSADEKDGDRITANQALRQTLYARIASFVRAYAALGSEILDAGYTEQEAKTIVAEAAYYENVRAEVKLASGDYIDLKMYEPAMRHLIDTYIQAGEMRKLSVFDDVGLLNLIVERGAAFVNELPEGIAANRDAIAETIENNVRKVIIDETPVNPKFYERMSELLDQLIVLRKKQAIDYQTYLAKIAELAKTREAGPASESYPPSIVTPGVRALFDNLERNEALALAVDAAVRRTIQDGWRINARKTRRVLNEVEDLIAASRPDISDEERREMAAAILTLCERQSDY
jgi:type I restriction enzyme R subunit